MAITLILPYFPGETGVSAIRYSEDREFIESEIALTETDQPGMYSGSIAFDGPSYQSVQIYSDGADEPYGFWAIAVAADNTTADYAESIGELRRWATNQTEHDATQAAVASLASTGRVTVVNPVDNTGKITGAIVIGDDYLAVNGRAFVWTIPAITGITAATAVAKFGGKSDDDEWLVTGSVTVSGSNWVLSFNLPRTATEDFTPALFDWSVEVAGVDGTEVTRVRSGKAVELVAKQT